MSDTPQLKKLENIAYHCDWSEVGLKIASINIQMAADFYEELESEIKDTSGIVIDFPRPELSSDMGIMTIKIFGLRLNVFKISK